MKIKRQTGRLPYDDKGRDWRDTDASIGIPKISNKPNRKKLEISKEGFPYRLEDVCPC